MEETRHESVTPKKQKRQTCLNCGDEVTDGKPYRRGLCAACYQSAHVAIKAGRITWEMLEKRGVALPATKGGRPKSRKGGTVLDQLIAESQVKKHLKRAKAIAKPKKP